MLGALTKGRVVLPCKKDVKDQDDLVNCTRVVKRFSEAGEILISKLSRIGGDSIGTCPMASK